MKLSVLVAAATLITAVLATSASAKTFVDPITGEKVQVEKVKPIDKPDNSGPKKPRR